MPSHMERSLEALRFAGWGAEKVEHWNYYARKRIDLLGMFDILAMKEELMLGVQVTDDDHLAEHKKKLARAKYFTLWLYAGGHISIMSWHKEKREWYLRVWYWSRIEREWVEHIVDSNLKSAKTRTVDEPLRGRLMTP